MTHSQVAVSQVANAAERVAIERVDVALYGVLAKLEESGNGLTVVQHLTLIGAVFEALRGLSTELVEPERPGRHLRLVTTDHDAGDHSLHVDNYSGGTAT